MNFLKHWQVCLINSARSSCKLSWVDLGHLLITRQLFLFPIFVYFSHLKKLTFPPWIVLTILLPYLLFRVSFLAFNPFGYIALFVIAAIRIKWSCTLSFKIKVLRWEPYFGMQDITRLTEVVHSQIDKRFWNQWEVAEGKYQYTHSVSHRNGVHSACVFGSQIYKS